MEFNYLNKYPNFKKIVSKVAEKSHLQKRKIKNFHRKIDKKYFERAENFSRKFLNYLKFSKLKLDIATDAYLKMCADMMISHLYFYKYGKYPLNNQRTAFEKVYDNKKEMKSYVYGIALSQFLWSTHYAMYSFFIRKINIHNIKIKKYLEVGCGHGLFLYEAIKKYQNAIDYEVVDISKTSINITKSIIDYLTKKKIKINYNLQDVLKYKSKSKFDFIEMGEVLEHVDEPGKLLKKINNLLTNEGKVFLSTCVDCPTIDHVYHFKSVNDIESLINASGFKIEERLILPVENLPMKEIIKKKITINYCAILNK